MHRWSTQGYQSLSIYNKQQKRRADEIQVMLNEQRRDDAISQHLKKSGDQNYIYPNEYGLFSCLLAYFLCFSAVNYSL